MSTPADGTYPYYATIRWDERTRSVVGISAQTITWFRGKAKEDDPAPLASMTDPAFAELAAMCSASAVAERDALRIERDALLAEKATLTQQVQTLTQERDAARAALQAAEAQLQPLPAVVAEGDAAVARVAELEAQLDAILNPANPPLIPTTVMRRAGVERWMQLREASKTDTLLMVLLDWIVAAREVLTTEPIFATGTQYAISRGYATQAEIDAWFAPGE